MKRGDIYFANLDPTQGSEIKKIRPVLVVSNDANNKAAHTVTVLPITSNAEKVFPFEVLLKASQSNLPKDSKILAQQIRTIDKSRLSVKCLGHLSSEVLKKVEQAMKLHLGM